MKQSLAKQSVIGLGWSTLGNVVAAGFQLVVSGVLARLLTPADFGLMAMANVLLRFGNYFSQMGLGVTLVQKRTLSRAEVQVAFTSSVLLGMLFTALIWNSAPWASRFFHDERLTYLIQVLAISYTLTGLSTTALSLLRRDMDFKRTAVVEISSLVVGSGGVGLILANLGYGVWSLVYATLVQRLLASVLSYAFTRHPVRLSFDWKVFRPMASFGGLVSIISFGEFIGANLDTLIIGRFASPVDLGLYNRAFMLAQLPLNFVVVSITRVMLPAFSKLQAEPLKLKDFYLKAYSVIGIITFSAAVGAVPAARELFLVILGNQWLEGIPLFQVLVLAMPFMFLSSVSGVALEALGWLKTKLVLQIISVVFLVISYLLLYRLGLVGFATAVVASAIFRFLAYMVVIHHVIPGFGRDLVAIWKTVALICGVVLAVMYFGSMLMRSLHLPHYLVLSGQILLGLTVLVIWLNQLGYIKSAMELLKGGVTAEPR